MTVEECEKLIAARGMWRGAVLASRATMGLAAVLKSLALPCGSGVLMPVMLCANVVHAVRGAGLEPLFVDMEAGDFGFGIDLAKAEKVVEQRKDVRALLAVPLFGGGLDEVGMEGLQRGMGWRSWRTRHSGECGTRNAECGIAAGLPCTALGRGRSQTRGAELPL